MAYTTFATNDPQTVKIWSKLLFREALKNTNLFKKLVGKDKRAAVQWLVDLEKGAGDTIKYDILMQATGSGVTGSNDLWGNEEALVYYQDSVVIEQLRNAHSFRRMTQQRTLHDLRADAMMNLSDWFAMKFESYLIRMLCGDTTLTHGAAGIAPDSEHIFFSGGEASLAAMTANDVFRLEDIDYAIERAKTLTPPFRPVKIDGEEYYILILHPYSVTDMKLSIASNAHITWPDIQMYAAERGKNNPIFTGALGLYNNTIIFESPYIITENGGASSDVPCARNLFLGAQAGVFALGNAYDKIDQKNYGTDNLFFWEEQRWDYGDIKGIAAGSIFGIKKTRFNGKDYATMVIESAAAAH